VFRLAVLSRDEARARRRELCDEGRDVVFTNGCFDLLHKGHLHLLEQAKNQGDYLIVGLNTDNSIRRLKGAPRPVKSESDRAVLLDALEYVDDVVLFDEDTPLALIEALSPDVLVKGSDYDPSEVVGAEHVREQGGNLYLVDLLPDHSTTALIDDIRSAQSREDTGKD
jgi:D-beta-D-heptose 7-phosphate kinase/D-beta-D-heptose 1-phosphate adenosyltransferase